MGIVLRLTAIIAGAMWLAGCGAPADSQRDWPAPSPALWAVSTPEGERGWLFGTVHALPTGLDWRSAPVEAALAEAGVLVVEISDFDDPAAPSRFRQLAQTPGQPDLLDRVPAQDRDGLAALLEASGYDEGDFANVESWAAAIMLGSAASANDPANGVDRALLAAAPKVIALETTPEQLAIFDRLPTAAQQAMLAAAARDWSDAAADKALLAWLTGDIAEIERLLREGMLGQPELKSALLAGRNQRWAEPVARLIQNGRAPFVAVGLAHMLTEDGLPALLRARGFRVERVQ